MKDFKFYFDTLAEDYTLFFLFPTVVVNYDEDMYDVCIAWLFWQVGVKYEF